MKVHSSVLLVFAFVACTTDRVTRTNEVTPVYSDDERTAMLACLGMSDIAGYVAQQKLDGVPLEQVKNHYASSSDPKVA